QALYTTIIKAHRLDLVPLMTELWATCKTSADFQDVNHLFHWLLNLSESEQKLALSFCYAKSIGRHEQTTSHESLRLGLRPLAEVLRTYVGRHQDFIRDYEQARTANGLCELLHSLETPDCGPLGQITAGTLLKQLANAPQGTVVADDVFELVYRVLLVTSRVFTDEYIFDLPNSLDDHDWIKALEVLARKPQQYTQVTYSLSEARSNPNADIEALAQEIDADLLLLDPTPASVILEYLLQIPTPEDVKLRYLLALIFAQLAQNPIYACHPALFTRLMELSLDHKSSRVLTASMQGILALIKQQPPHGQEALLGKAQFEKAFSHLIKSKATHEASYADKGRAITLLEGAWACLDEEERDTYYGQVMRLATGFGLHQHFFAIVFSFLGSHADDVSLSIKNKMFASADLARIIQNFLFLRKSPAEHLVALDTIALFEEHATGETLTAWQEFHEQNVGVLEDSTRAYVRRYQAEGHQWEQATRLRAIEKLAKLLLDPQKGFVSTQIMVSVLKHTPSEDVAKYLEVLLAHEGSVEAYLTGTQIQDASTEAQLLRQSRFSVQKMRLIFLIASVHPRCVSPELLEETIQRFNPNTTQGMTHFVARDMGRALREPKFHDLLDKAWQRLGFHSIEMRDGGNGLSTLPYFMETYLAPTLVDFMRQAADMVIDLTSTTENAPSIPPTDPFSIRHDSITNLLGQYPVVSGPVQRGRSFVYQLSDGRQLVFKCLRVGQTPSSLARELEWLRDTRDIGLRSSLPQPLLDKSDKPLLFQLSDAPLHFVNTNPALDFDASAAIAFIAPGGARDYYRYLDDVSLNDATFMRALTDAVHDLFRLDESLDVLHTAPIALFHNNETGAKFRAHDAGR
ncbi:MAG TPA: hypothetical protein VJC18_10770, partial [bacterium]|nr:hypothetical protein [bacterium]